MRKVLLSGALMLIGLAAPAAPVLASAAAPAAAAAAAPSHPAAPGIYHVPIKKIVLPGLGSLLGGPSAASAFWVGLDGTTLATQNSLSPEGTSFSMTWDIS